MPMTSIHPAATTPSTLFTDTNGNGVQDVGEAALSGQSVDPWRDGNPLTSTTSDSNGHYTFNNLWGGDYAVSTWVPSGYTISTPLDSNGTTAATLTGAATTTADIGFWPTLVTVAAVNDAIEGGTPGTFRFTRTGDLSQPLTVYYTVGGTATPTDDYTPLSGSVTFAANSATADVTISPIDDSADESNETVIVTLSSDTGYAIGANSNATVTIIDTFLPPVAFDNWVTTSIGTAVNTPVLDNALDLHGDTLTVSAVTQGEHGSVTLNTDGTVTYTPNTGYIGEDSFTYTVEDAGGNTATGTITVTVTAPLAPPTSVWTAPATAVTIAVLDLAFDPNEDALTPSAVTQGAHGSVVFNTDGSVTYTPDTGFTGDDSFTYTVEDSNGNEATGTITVSVSDSEPVALDVDTTTDENTATTVIVLNSTLNPAGGTLTVSAVTQGTHGSVTLNNDGTVTYTPNTGYTGTDSFTYTVQDGSSNTATGTVTITIGLPTVSPVAGIENDLGEIEDNLAAYDNTTPDTITSILSGVANSISDFLNDTSTLFVSLDLDTTGINKSFRPFVEEQLAAYKKQERQYLFARGVEQALGDVLAANKAQIEFLYQQQKNLIKAANPDKVQIAALNIAIGKLLDFHIAGFKLADNLEPVTSNAYILTAKTWLALKRPPTSLPGLGDPPPLPVHPNLKLLVPRI